MKINHISIFYRATSKSLFVCNGALTIARQSTYEGKLRSAACYEMVAHGNSNTWKNFRAVLPHDRCFEHRDQTRWYKTTAAVLRCTWPPSTETPSCAGGCSRSDVAVWAQSKITKDVDLLMLQGRRSRKGETRRGRRLQRNRKVDGSNLDRRAFVQTYCGRDAGARNTVDLLQLAPINFGQTWTPLRAAVFEYDVRIGLCDDTMVSLLSRL